jgi:hypothetical protein
VLSRFAVILIIFIYACTRIFYAEQAFSVNKNHNVASWDAFGYYAYLPSVFIYRDVKKIVWADSLQRKYNLRGGEDFYQFRKIGNGNKVGKYFIGVAVLQAPFFLCAHAVCKLSGSFPADGFSLPYQVAIMLAALVYFAISVLLLRKLLLRYFADEVSASTLIIAFLATNCIQYVSVDSCLSHAYILPIYASLLLLADNFYRKPKCRTAATIGAICGLAIICRPTELVAVFIPLLWYPDSMCWRQYHAAKWRMHIIAGLTATAIIGMQVFYWYTVTGKFLYDVGSSWVFFNPNWRVLIGWEKGWLIYTPLCALFLVGLFLAKGKIFRRSIIVFTVLNIYIVIAWKDWHYGASYSCRALVQSYPAMCLLLACVLERFTYRNVFVVTAVVFFFIACNLFQVWQYNKGILHCRDMNRSYYGAIFFNWDPSAQDYALLDGSFQAPSTAVVKTQRFPAQQLSPDSAMLIPINGASSLELQGFISDKAAIYGGSVIEVQVLQLDTVASFHKVRLNTPDAVQTGVKKLYYSIDLSSCAAGSVIKLSAVKQIVVDSLTLSWF